MFNYHKIKSYIINLESSKERLKYVKNNIKDLGFDLERINAINGNDLSDNYIKQHVDLATYYKKFAHYPKKGTIGCSLSHIKAWERFLKSDNEFALICEDDIDFDPIILRDVIDELISLDDNVSKKNKYWDVVNFQLCAHRKILGLNIKNIIDKYWLKLPMKKVTGAGCYLINRKAATKLLKYALPIVMPVDHYFSKIWKLNIIFTIVTPSIVKQNFGDSNINESHNLNVITHDIGRIRKMIYFMQKHLLFIHDPIKRIFHNVKLYNKLKK